MGIVTCRFDVTIEDVCCESDRVDLPVEPDAVSAVLSGQISFVSHVMHSVYYLVQCLGLFPVVPNIDYACTWE